MLSVTGMGIKNGIFILIMRQFFKDVEQPGGGRLCRWRRSSADVPFDHAAECDSCTGNGVSRLRVAVERLPVYQPVHEREDVLDHDASRIGTGILTPSIVTLRNNTGMLLLIAPLLLVYVLMQRHFIESVERTGLVE